VRVAADIRGWGGYQAVVAAIGHPPVDNDNDNDNAPRRSPHLRPVALGCARQLSPF
jgi:hypothetical protein